MSKLVFLVDGRLEQKFIQSVCPGQPVRYINCNGDDVAIETMAKFIASLIRILDNKYYPIVIVIDRESRDITSCDMCSVLLRYLKENEEVQDKVIIGVADRMIENWILADPEIVRSHPNYNDNSVSVCESTNGKGKINNCINLYHETTIGVELLLKCRASIIKVNSPSFANLFNQLQLEDCQWLNK